MSFTVTDMYVRTLNDIFSGFFVISDRANFDLKWLININLHEVFP